MSFCPNDHHAIHVVSFDVPYPADYGGVIDVFYKVKALYDAGWKVHLHCFAYGRPPQEALKRYCDEVHYYRRRKLGNPFEKLPYIVSSRANHQLLDRLTANDWPILFEGLHTAFYGTHPALAGRFRILRTHNIEHIYYRHLARIESHPLRRWFFYREANRLQAYEHVAEHFDVVAAISPADHQRMQLKYGNSRYVPVFHPHTEVKTRPGTGEYALYHGNLKVGENREAALYLMEKVFPGLGIPLVVAGKNPSRKIVETARKDRNIRLVPNPDAEQMRLLTQNAQVHVLPTFQSTGIKLKLLNVMFNGRHVLVNPAMVKHTGLEPFAISCQTSARWQEAVAAHWETPFSRDALKMRAAHLHASFNNQTSLHQLLGQPTSAPMEATRQLTMQFSYT